MSARTLIINEMNEFKGKLNVFLNTHKKSMHKGDDPIKYPYINDLDDIKVPHLVI